jgi:NHLM bacteriocin system ABC transporter peptidase/ATP-binding protein
MRAEPADLRTIDAPAILHWNFNHFVVFEGFAGDAVQLNDPAVGRRRVSATEFDESFTGIAITFAPSATFEPGGRPFDVRGAIGERLRGRSNGVALVVLAGLLGTLPALVAPVLSAVFVDDVLARGDRSFLPALLIGIVVATVLRSGSKYVQRHYLMRLQNAIAASGSVHVLWRVLRLPTEFFSHRSTADVANRVDLNLGLSQLLAGQLATVLLNGITALLLLVVMVVYSWQLTIVAVALNVVNIAALRAIVRRQKVADQRLLKERAALATTTIGGIQSIETLKATSSESAYFAKWAGELARLLRVRSELVTPTVMLGAVPTITAAFGVAAVIVLGGVMVIEGQMSVGELVAFQSLAISFGWPIGVIVGSAGLYNTAAAQLARLDDILGNDLAPAYRRQPADPANLPAQLSGSIELRRVTFGYSPLDPPLIDELSLSIPAGARIALVGGSGAGKSTVVKLITGLLEPWSGEIRFDDRMAAEIPPDVWASTCTVVDQNVFLLAGTVADNLSLWDRTVSESAVRRAAVDAAIDEDIAKRPGGYESIVDEGGRNWSGGQAQRLEIARALVNDPSIVVLDEATSALDPIVEERILAAIRRRGCTTIMVAHRLSTIRDCDEILVLDRGRIVERGTHHDLLALGGHYAALVSAGGDVGE